MPQTFSPIQNHILSKLKNSATLRYSELRPGKVPNDLFNYHLQFLVKKGFVAKVAGGYGLSGAGIKHVADPFSASDAITSLFKVNVITIVSRVVENGIEILNQIRGSHPSYGKVGVIGGVVLKGEPIEQAAARKLEQETCLRAQFKLVACERRIMYKSNELFSDVVFPIAYASAYTGELQQETVFGHNMWVPLEQAIANESAEYDSIVSIRAVLEAIKRGSIGSMPFFFKENIQSDASEK